MGTEKLLAHELMHGGQKVLDTRAWGANRTTNNLLCRSTPKTGEDEVSTLAGVGDRLRVTW